MKKHLIIDTDPGIDDAVAIAISLFADTYDVKLISTVSGNVGIDKTTYNAHRLLKFFNKEHIPVAKGASHAFIELPQDASHVHGASGMDGWEFEAPSAPTLQEHAVIAMRDMLINHAKPTTIMAIGPLTNIALLLRMYPEVKPKIEQIIFMGGSMNRGNCGVMSEFNIALDPEAAHIVLTSNLPLFMLPLDIGMKALILPEDIEKIEAMNHTGQMLCSLFKHYRSGSYATGLRMYDATAISYLLAPELYETSQVNVTVELNGTYTRGCTVVDLRNYSKRPPNVTVVTDVNHTEFRKWFIEALSKWGYRTKRVGFLT